MGIVILLIGTGTGELNTFPLAEAVEPIVYELTPIIRVQSEEREGQSLPTLSCSFPHTPTHSDHPAAISTVDKVYR